MTRGRETGSASHQISIILGPESESKIFQIRSGAGDVTAILLDNYRIECIIHGSQLSGLQEKYVCGIAGYLDKARRKSSVGRIVLDMLEPLSIRGPDSAGVALLRTPGNGSLNLSISLGSNRPSGENAREVIQVLQEAGTVRAQRSGAHYLRVTLDFQGSPDALERRIRSVDAEIEVISMGRCLEVLKQVGSPADLDAAFDVSRITGTHGIGHTRMSTESKVDLSHSQPFWAHGYPDLAIAHNGHITNYHGLRRRYEQEGVRFYTRNDSEVIGIYLGKRLSEEMSLQEALEASIRDLDGSFSYVAATADAIGFARDPFAFKPLLFSETEAFVAIATEEISIRSALGGRFEVAEAPAGEVRTWQK